MSKEIKDAAQQQAEQAFDGFMLWMKRGAYISVAILLFVVVGCNSGVDTDAYPAYNGEQYDPQGMSE
tara:strand:+ start:14981 stop:15181 length:201 start_codon:yes stop_codon:yes gene_type:complete